MGAAQCDLSLFLFSFLTAATTGLVAAAVGPSAAQRNTTQRRVWTCALTGLVVGTGVATVLLGATPQVRVPSHHTAARVDMRTHRPRSGHRCCHCAAGSYATGLRVPSKLLMRLSYTVVSRFATHSCG
jgi:hypothetical protein